MDEDGLNSHVWVLDELELRRTLVSLSCREYKLLQKHPQGDDIKPTDVFSFNDQFYTDKDQLSMTTATLSEVIEKNARLNTTVLFAKDQQIDAVIVRIMKSRSTASHGSLLNEVTGVVRFPVTVSFCFVQDHPASNMNNRRKR